MLVSTTELLDAADRGSYALGAFNIYNLEGVRAVIAAAETERSPVMLQLLPKALKLGGAPLVALCLRAAEESAVPVSVHLDHTTSSDIILEALEARVLSIMADGSRLSFAENVAFTRKMTALAHKRGAAVEAELGRLTGTEDGLTVPEYEAQLTKPEQAADFVAQTGVDALAVCVGNVHGRYPGEPRLDFERLAAINSAVTVPLVMHGASGLPQDMVRRSIELGIRKFNVNTELREAYLRAVESRWQVAPPPDLLDLMQDAINAMRAVVSTKLDLFGSVGKA